MTTQVYDLTALVKEIRDRAEASASLATSLMVAASVAQQNTRFFTELADLLENR